MRRILVALALATFAALLSPPASAAAPGNDDRQNAEPIASVPATLTQDTTEATFEADEPQPCGSTGATVWYSITASENGYLSVDTVGSDFDTVLSVYPVGSDDPVICSDDKVGFQAAVVFPVSAGHTYEIQAGGYDYGQGAATGSLTVNVGPPVAGDIFANAVDIDRNVFRGRTDTSLATREDGEPDPSCAAVDNTIWYRYAPASNGAIVLSTTGSDYDTVLAVYEQEGAGFDGLSELRCDDDPTGLVPSNVAMRVQAGHEYYVQAGGFEGAYGDLKLTVVGR